MSKRSKTAVTVVFWLIVIFLISLDHAESNRRTGKSFQCLCKNSGSEDYRKYNGKTFQVINVVDGDTFDINVPDNDRKYTRIRLWGVDTPETKNEKTGVMYYGPQACEFAKEILLGKKVKMLLSETKTRGKYYRLLAYVQIHDDRIFNEELIKEGLAYADLRFEHLYFYKYQQLESLARKNKKGLWENVRFDQLPQWLRNKRPDLLGINEIK